MLGPADCFSECVPRRTSEGWMGVLSKKRGAVRSACSWWWRQSVSRLLNAFVPPASSGRTWCTSSLPSQPPWWRCVQHPPSRARAAARTCFQAAPSRTRDAVLVALRRLLLSRVQLGHSPGRGPGAPHWGQRRWRVMWSGSSPLVAGCEPRLVLGEHGLCLVLGAQPGGAAGGVFAAGSVGEAFRVGTQRVE